MKKIYFLLSIITTISLSAQVSITHRVDITDYLAGGAATLDPTGIRIGKETLEQKELQQVELL